MSQKYLEIYCLELAALTIDNFDESILALETMLRSRQEINARFLELKAYSQLKIDSNAEKLSNDGKKAA